MSAALSRMAGVTSLWLGDEILTMWYDITGEIVGHESSTKRASQVRSQSLTNDECEHGLPPYVCMLCCSKWNTNAGRL